MHGNIYDRVTAHLVAELEKGVIPWACPWDRSPLRLPFNAATERHYRGVNTLILWLRASEKRYASPGWLTYRQIEELGGHLRKLEGAPEGRTGQKAATIYYMGKRTFEATDRQTGEVMEKERWVARAYSVFNLDQTVGLPDTVYLRARGPETPLREHGEVRAIEHFIRWTKARIDHGGDQAFYRPKDDLIVLPEKGRFASPEDYEATRFHELVHWSGHESRLHRTFGGKGTEAYAREELAAEIGAAFLCAVWGIAGKLQHAEYLAGYLEVLKSDPKAIFEAAAHARRAVDWLMDLVGILSAPEAQPEFVSDVA